MFGLRTKLVIIVMCNLIAAAKASSQLTVSLYNDAEIPRSTLQRAEEVAGRIYLQAGITIEWQDGTGPLSSEKIADSSEGAGSSVTLRIVSRPRTLSGEDFGIAFVGDDGRPQQADVFFASIEHFRETSSASISAILGHVMAHELGHLLLGQKSHSETGIMQARWEGPQLRQLSMGALRFGKHESERIRNRLSNPNFPRPTAQTRSEGAEKVSVDLGFSGRVAVHRCDSRFDLNCGLRV
jgi:hypothetical protein